MLTNAETKLIRSLATKKGRENSGFCLVEGEKNIKAAQDHLEFQFTREDTPSFDELVTTETPQNAAGVAKVPEWTLDDVELMKTIVVLDGIQDPGNVGNILRLCLGFDAGLILVESADPTSSKVIRASAGAMFNVPWVKVGRDNATILIDELDRPIYRLENVNGSKAIDSITLKKVKIIIAGSEGSGIKLDVKAPSVRISHSKKLESLNVAAALAIVLNACYQAE
ncbi:MAG: RNA methyltransferase [bacterium]